MAKENVFKSKGAKPITENKRQWDELIDKIIQGEVVPVIGPEFLAKDDDDANKWVNPHQELINMLAETKNITPCNHKSFSELLYDDAFPASERMDIYNLIGEVFEPEIKELDNGKIPEDGIFHPSALLMKLLRVCKFRFVITTSFTPVVEYAMKDIYGNGNVNILNFSNNPLGNDDLKDIDDIYRPTVYYMFGRVCRQSERYVVNDSDMLSFCRSWLSNAPSNLVNVLRDKYLLLLGNNYSDWLCRFVWYSMKTKLKTELKGMVVNPSAKGEMIRVAVVDGDGLLEHGIGFGITFSVGENKRTFDKSGHIVFVGCESFLNIRQSIFSKVLSAAYFAFKHIVRSIFVSGENGFVAKSAGIGVVALREITFGK